MGGYFKPLRRKIGVATLGLACALMMIWIRSLLVYDWLAFPNDWDFTSERGRFGLHSWKYVPIFGAPPVHGWHVGDVTAFGEQSGVPYWSIAIPLTLLSAWFLLSKPRPRQTQVEPVHEKAP